MKNANLPNSSNSLSSDYDDYSSSIRRIMVPIRELDFESRIMFNAKLPKKKPFSDQIRKNDFVVDLNNYKSPYAGTNNSQNQQLFKTLRYCFNQEDNNSENISYNLNEINNSNLTVTSHDLKNSTECKNEGNNSLVKSESINSKFNPVSGSLHHQILSTNSKYKLAKLDKADSMMMTTILNPNCKTGSTFSKLNIKSLNKTVKNINSNLDWKRKQESINNLTNPIEKINDNQNSSPNQDHTDPNQSLLEQEKLKLTKTKTLDESNNQKNLRMNNRVMCANKSRNYKYRIWQCKIYNYLERPRGWKSGLYHILM